MKISKTIFKNYTRCPRVVALDDLYRKRTKSDVSIFGDEQNEKLIDILHTMFDQDTGDDLIETINVQTDTLLPYYTKFEEIAMNMAEVVFGGPIIHSPNTKEQKKFSFTTPDHEYYCYVDGYLERDDEILIFEVKATTSKKFIGLGPKKGGVVDCVFSNNDYSSRGITNPKTQKQIYPKILKLRDDLSQDAKKYEKSLVKLYDRYSSVGKYVYDIAVEKMIVSESRHQYNLKNKKVKYYLAVLNSEYVFDGQYINNEADYSTSKDFEEIVTFIDVSDILLLWDNEVYKMREELEQAILKLDPEAGGIERFCEKGKNTQCPFVPTCWKDLLVEGSILNFFGKHHGFKNVESEEKLSIFDLHKKGINTMDALSDEWINRPNNKIQKYCFINNKEYINYAKIMAAYESLKWPLYYLDFESFSSPLPRFVGEKPYSQSVFQYSLHIEKDKGKCDFDTDHQEFLASNFDDCRLNLVQALIRDIDLSNGGTVISHNKGFECGRIKELSEIFPEHKKALEKIIDNVFDTIYLVNNNKAFYSDLGFTGEELDEVNYYHKDLVGSYSIKKVLPLFSDLSYNDLVVGNGLEAVAAYAEFQTLSGANLEELRTELKKYCKQDTWAMVLILHNLIAKVKKETNIY